MEFTTDYPRRAAASLMALMGMSKQALVSRAGLGDELLTMFLSGKATSMSEESFETLFRHLGVVATEAGAKLSPAVVHYFKLDCGYKANRASFADFRMILPLIDDALGMEVEGPDSRHQSFFIRGSNVRIVLFVRKPRLGGALATLADLGVPPGPFKGFESALALPPYYQHLINERKLTPNYFDTVLKGGFANESLEAIRIAALENDIPLGEIMEWIQIRASAKASAAESVDLMVSNVQPHMKNVYMLFPTRQAKVEARGEEAKAEAQSPASSQAPEGVLGVMEKIANG